MFISKNIAIHLTKAQEEYCIEILDLLLELWNIGVKTNKEYYEKTHAVIPNFEFDAVYYPQIAASRPEFKRIPSKARQEMIRRMSSVVWKHMIAYNGDREWPFKSGETSRNKINSFFFCRYGIRFINDTRHVWISNIHVVKLMEKGYLTEDDIMQEYVTSGRICYRRETKRWFIRFILSVPDDYFEKRHAKTKKKSSGIGIDVDLHNYAVIIPEHPSKYSDPRSLPPGTINPCLNQKSWAIFKRIQAFDEKIFNKVRINMAKMGYDGDDYKASWSIADDDKPFIYHTKNIEKLMYRRNRTYEHLINIRKNFIKNFCNDIVRSNPEFVVVEHPDLYNLLTRSHGNHMLRRRLGMSSFGFFRIFLKEKCKEYRVPFIEAPLNFPSSQVCSNCGTQRSKRLSIEDKVFYCDNPKCKLHNIGIDRDINAATNLMKYGKHLKTSIVTAMK